MLNTHVLKYKHRLGSGVTSLSGVQNVSHRPVYLVSSTRLGVDKVKPKGWFKYFLQIDQRLVWFWRLGGCGGLGCWPLRFPCHFENGASSKIDDVLAKDGGLLHVLPLTVHLNFFDRQVGGTILKLSYFLNFFVGPLLDALMMFLLNMVNYSMSFPLLSTSNFV